MPRMRSRSRVDPSLLYPMLQRGPCQDYDERMTERSPLQKTNLANWERASEPCWADFAFATSRRRAVPCDVLMRDTEYVLRAELPGCSDGDVTVQVDKHVLSFSAAADMASGSDESERVLMAERTRGEVSRSFKIPKDVDEASMRCSIDKGVLTVVMPRNAPKPTARTVPVTKGTATVAGPITSSPDEEMSSSLSKQSGNVEGASTDIEDLS